MAMSAALVEHDYLARLDVADVFGADDVERAGL
jgi:hypothetical protein